jgi:hypothetical protein
LKRFKTLEFVTLGTPLIGRGALVILEFKLHQLAYGIGSLKAVP